MIVRWLAKKVAEHINDERYHEGYADGFRDGEDSSAPSREEVDEWKAAGYREALRDHPRGDFP